jgi:hypothetical protein
MDHHLLGSHVSQASTYGGSIWVSKSMETAAASSFETTQHWKPSKGSLWCCLCCCHGCGVRGVRCKTSLWIRDTVQGQIQEFYKGGSGIFLKKGGSNHLLGQICIGNLKKSYQKGGGGGPDPWTPWICPIVERLSSYFEKYVHSQTVLYWVAYLLMPGFPAPCLCTCTWEPHSQALLFIL